MIEQIILGVLLCVCVYQWLGAIHIFIKYRKLGKTQDKHVAKI